MKFWKHKNQVRIRKPGDAEEQAIVECECGAVIRQEEMEEHKQICQETPLEGR